MAPSRVFRFQSVVFLLFPHAIELHSHGLITSLPIPFIAYNVDRSVYRVMLFKRHRNALALQSLRGTNHRRTA